jgi:hypothetical protein
VKAQRVTPETEVKPEAENRKTASAEPTGGTPEASERIAQPSDVEPAATKSHKPERKGSGQPLPEGTALLNKIRPHMRRNRNGSGGSGSTSFLSRALKCNESDLKAAFSAMGLTMPSAPNDKPGFTEIGSELWWLSLDSRGGLWINGREKKPGETLAAAQAAEEAPVATASAPAEAQNEGTALSAPATSESIESTAAPSVPAGSEQAAPAGEQPTGSPGSSVLASVRLLLKETKTGAIAAKVDRVAEQLGKTPEEVTATLVSAGLKVPEKPREKPMFAEHAGEIFWLNKNAKGELWLNAKPSKFAPKDESEGETGEGEVGEAETGAAEQGDDKKSRRPRGKKKVE